MKPNVDVLTMKKLIITAAITGGLHGKELNPNLPEQPDEQAQAAYDCYNAGAAICHLHVRDGKGKSTGDLNVYKEAVSKIKAKCNIITQIGNGIGWYYRPDGTPYSPPLEERMRLLDIEPKPDMITLNAGTMHFQDVLFPNPPEWNEKFIQGAQERNLPVECECYDISHVMNVLRFVERGVLKTPVHFSFVLGITGGISATPASMLYMLDEIPEGSTWQVITISKYQLPMTISALCMGANIRTGLEDNIYISHGVLAKSNAQLVERMIRIARDLGREIATPDEARKILGVWVR